MSKELEDFKNILYTNVCLAYDHNALTVDEARNIFSLIELTTMIVCETKFKQKYDAIFEANMDTIKKLQSKFSGVVDEVKHSIVS